MPSYFSPFPTPWILILLYYIVLPVGINICYVIVVAMLAFHFKSDFNMFWSLINMLLCGQFSSLQQHGPYPVLEEF